MYYTNIDKRQKLQGEIQMNNETQAAKSAAIYVRVSTDRQAEKGYSISEQELKLKSLCVAHGLEVYKVYIDDGYTGSHIDRPALKELLRDVWDGKVKNVVVYRLDRLSRDMQDMLEIIRRIFMPTNTRLISQTENIDTSTHVGRLAINILTSFAELEKDIINERMEMGRVGRAKSGRWHGKRPFGYDYDKEKGILVPNADAIIVKQIYDMYLHGHKLNHIANELGFPSSSSVLWILRSKASHMALFITKASIIPDNMNQSSAKKLMTWQWHLAKSINDYCLDFLIKSPSVVSASIGEMLLMSRDWSLSITGFGARDSFMTGVFTLVT